MKKVTVIFGQKLTFDTVDKSLFVENLGDGHSANFSKQKMENIAHAHRGCNRIYKPIPLLFWTDCKNGQTQGWELEDRHTDED